MRAGGRVEVRAPAARPHPPVGHLLPRAGEGTAFCLLARCRDWKGVSGEGATAGRNPSPACGRGAGVRAVGCVVVPAPAAGPHPPCRAPSPARGRRDSVFACLRVVVIGKESVARARPLDGTPLPLRGRGAGVRAGGRVVVPAPAARPHPPCRALLPRAGEGTAGVPWSRLPERRCGKVSSFPPAASNPSPACGRGAGVRAGGRAVVPAPAARPHPPWRAPSPARGRRDGGCPMVSDTGTAMREGVFIPAGCFEPLSRLRERGRGEGRRSRCSARACGATDTTLSGTFSRAREQGWRAAFRNAGSERRCEVRICARCRRHNRG